METTKKNMSRTSILRELLAIKQNTDDSVKKLWDESNNENMAKIRIQACVLDVRHISSRLQNLIERV